MNGVTITEHLPLRSLVVVLIATFVLLVSAGYLYVLKRPLAELASARQTLSGLQSSQPPAAALSAQIETTEREITDLESRLHGAGPALAANEMVAFIIGRLDRLARDRNVQLLGVTPGEISQVFEFDEIPFHVEVIGTYFDLVNWLHEAERELGPMVVKSFDIVPAAESESRRMRLTMVSYRSSGDAG